MRVSIVTPSLNQGEFIERTILSVISQDHDDVEHIVIDGGSTDGTIDVLKRYTGRIIWRSERDSGQANAINKGLRLASGEVVSYLCADDTYEPGALAAVISFFTSHIDCKWVYGKCRIVDVHDREIRTYITRYKNLLSKRYDYRKLLRENFISQPATFWRRDLLEEIGYLNEAEHFCMDYEYWLRLGSRYPARVIPAYLANFRYHARSKSGSVDRRQFRDELRLARKFGAAHPASILLHAVNYHKIVIAYRILKILGW